MCLPTTNQSLGGWSNNVADISVEPIPLTERGRRLPSANVVDRKEEVWEIVCRSPERTSWMLEETNC